MAKEKQTEKKHKLLKERDEWKFRKWRTSGENVLTAIFKYAAGKDAPEVPVKIDGEIVFKKGVRFNERTHLYEDHYKLPAVDLPKAVYTGFGQEAMDGKESWKALKAFDKAVDKKKEQITAMIEAADESMHSMKNLRFILANLESVQHQVHLESVRYGLARIGEDNKLEFDSYKVTRARVIAAYDAKAERRNARVLGEAESAATLKIS